MGWNVAKAGEEKENDVKARNKLVNDFPTLSSFLEIHTTIPYSALVGFLLTVSGLPLAFRLFGRDSNTQCLDPDSDCLPGTNPSWRDEPFSAQEEV